MTQFEIVSLIISNVFSFVLGWIFCALFFNKGE